MPPVEAADIELLETEMDRMDQQLPELRHFVLPGGHPAASMAHVCRTVCRRAERGVIRLADHDEVPDRVVMYLNRLSDYFFVLSRMICFEQKVDEVKWVPKKSGE